MNEIKPADEAVQRPAEPSIGANCRIAETARIHSGVVLGDNVVIEDFCIVGYPPRGYSDGELLTQIGTNTVLRSHTVIYAGSRIGQDCQFAHGVYIREHSSLGDHCSIGMNVIVEHHCIVGNNVRIQGQAGLCEYTVVEDDAWIGPRVVTTNVPHPTCSRAKECLAGPVIRRGAIIGANVVISPDLDVGARSLIGAGSVLVKSVEDEAIMFGVPARRLGTIEKISCAYDLMGGRSPYVPDPEPQRTSIPLVDLATQYQQHKQDLQLALDRVILNTRFIQGKEVREFEEAFAQFCGTRFSIGVSSGTEALRLVLQALGIGPGDEVITTPHTFVATVGAIVNVGATPVLVDIEPETYNIDPAQIRARITPRTKAIIPVHLYGHPAPMPEIMAIADEFGLQVVEDAAQAHGAVIAGRRVGQWGRATCFSFYPGKNLGAFGDAGAIATDDEDLARLLAKLRDHGRASKYVSDMIGVNARLDTLQAAVLLIKLPHLQGWNEARRKLAERYCQELQGLPLTLPKVRPGCEHVYHLFVVRTDRRDALKDFLEEHGVSTGVHYPVPLHLQPALAMLGQGKGSFPEAERAAVEILSLPMYPELKMQQASYIAGVIRAFFAN